MVISVATPRRSICDAVLGGGRQLYQPLRCAFYDGTSWGGGLTGDGLAAALSEEATGGAPVSAGGKAAKNVLILMSDTGGGHRASAEALRDAFCLEFGDAYQVFVRDLGKEYGGWPLNHMERSYKFMIRHVALESGVRASPREGSWKRALCRGQWRRCVLQGPTRGCETG